LWLHSLKVAQLLRSAACLHTNQSRSYLNHLVQSLSICFWKNNYSKNMKNRERNPTATYIIMGTMTLLYGAEALARRESVWTRGPSQRLNSLEPWRDILRCHKHKWNYWWFSTVSRLPRMRGSTTDLFSKIFSPGLGLTQPPI